MKTNRWLSVPAAMGFALAPVLAHATTGDTYHSGQSGQEQSQNSSQKSSDTKMMSERFANNPEIVKEVQSALKERGYDIKKSDGKFGQRTRAELKKFQKSQGLESTGNLDQKTLSALGVDTSGAQAAGQAAKKESDSSKSKNGDEAGQLGTYGYEEEPFATPTPANEPGQIGESTDHDLGSGSGDVIQPGGTSGDAGEPVSR